ncbi:MAG: ATP-binding protein [Desulfobacterium sp.]
MQLSDENLNIPVRLFLPAIFILFVVVVMTAFIAWSTWQNLDRDRNNAVKWLLREADALTHVMETDAGAQVREGREISATLEQLMMTMGATENMAYIYCLDSRTGKVYYPPTHKNRSHAIMKAHAMKSLGETHKIIDIDGSIPVLELTRQLLLSNNKISLKIQNVENRQAQTQTLPAISIQGNGGDNPSDIHVVMGLTMDLYGEARRADLHHAAIMISILLALGAGAVFFVFVIRKYLEDLSRMQLLQSQVHKNEKFAAIGQLSASVAHEIRNPLSSIRGFAKFFVHQFKDNEEHREYAMIMVKEIDRINGVITDLITFARPLELHRKRVNAKTLVRHILRLIEGDSRSKGGVISMEIDDTMAPLFVDEDQMKQVLLNLVINALNALKPGQHITVGGAGKPGDCRGYLWIEDEGPGIPPGDQQRIFNPFFSGGNKGTGLGLAIAGKIVENHGGRLVLESPVPGKTGGCRFTISLPMTKKGDVC